MLRSAAGLALLGLTVLLAPGAHADRTLSAAQACAELRPGSVPVELTADLACQDPQAWQQQGMGPWVAPMTTEMAMVYPGSHRVNPADRWSDWVIP